SSLVRGGGASAWKADSSERVGFGAVVGLPDWPNLKPIRTRKKATSGDKSAILRSSGDYSQKHHLKRARRGRGLSKEQVRQPIDDAQFLQTENTTRQDPQNASLFQSARSYVENTCQSAAHIHSAFRANRGVADPRLAESLIISHASPFIIFCSPGGGTVRRGAYPARDDRISHGDLRRHFPRPQPPWEEPLPRRRQFPFFLPSPAALRSIQTSPAIHAPCNLHKADILLQLSCVSLIFQKNGVPEQLEKEAAKFHSSSQKLLQLLTHSPPSSRAEEASGMRSETSSKEKPESPWVDGWKKGKEGGREGGRKEGKSIHLKAPKESTELPAAFLSIEVLSKGGAENQKQLTVLNEGHLTSLSCSFGALPAGSSPSSSFSQRLLLESKNRDEQEDLDCSRQGTGQRGVKREGKDQYPQRRTSPFLNWANPEPSQANWRPRGDRRLPAKAQDVPTKKERQTEALQWAANANKGTGRSSHLTIRRLRGIRPVNTQLHSVAQDFISQGIMGSLKDDDSCLGNCPLSSVRNGPQDFRICLEWGRHGGMGTEEKYFQKQRLVTLRGSKLDYSKGLPLILLASDSREDDSQPAKRKDPPVQAAIPLLKQEEEQCDSGGCMSQGGLGREEARSGSTTSTESRPPTTLLWGDGGTVGFGAWREGHEPIWVCGPCSNRAEAGFGREGGKGRREREEEGKRGRGGEGRRREKEGGKGEEKRRKERRRGREGRKGREERRGGRGGKKERRRRKEREGGKEGI
ncbi:Ebna1, partial [Ophiophagus hannah]